MNHMTWSVQQLGRDNTWFFRASDMFEHDAKYWFRKYALDGNRGDKFRLCDGSIVVTTVINTGPYCELCK